MEDRAYPVGVLVRWFWKNYVRPVAPILLVSFLFMAAEGGALGLLSYMVRPMFDEVFIAGDRAAVFRVAFIVFAIFIGRAIAGFLQKVLSAIAGRIASSRLQRDMLRHMLTLDSSFYNIHSPGWLMTRLRGDTSGTIGIITSTFSAMGRDMVALLSLLAVAISIDWVWTLIAIAGAPIAFVPILILQRMIRKNARRIRDLSATVTTRLDEIFHGINNIKLNATEEYEAERFSNELLDLVRTGVRSGAMRAGIPALMDVIAAFGFLGVLSYGGLQIIDGEKTVGEFMSFFTAIALIFEPLRRLGNLSGAWQSALVNMERVYGIFQQRPEITSPPEPKPLPVPPHEADIELDGVSFSYGDRKVLDNVRFTAKAGQTTALVGASGAGKSTIFNLLPRLIDPDEGAVKIGGTNVADMDLGTLRSMFSVVSQDTLLFDETIRENVLLGQNVSDEQLNAALEAAHVSDFLPDLADDLDSQAGPRGSSLSGGQRQRVAIARALLRDTPFLLLDEATSALDAKSEKIVQQALEELSKGRTTLVIAHRLSTVRNADKIIVMDHGKVVDQGTHEELIARDGIYASLYKMQFSDSD